MICKNTFWCLIPARANSKSIKNKNIKLLGKHPLFIHSYITAKKIKKISKIFLSTDSIKYSKIAKKYKFNNIHIRSKKNSGDKSSDFDVFKEFLLYLKKKNLKLPEFIVHFRPTIPLRKKSTIERAIKKFINIKKNYTSLKSVTKFENDNYKNTFVIKNFLLKPLANINKKIDEYNSPRQLYPDTYYGNGIIDIYKTSHILKKKALYGKKVYPFLLNDPTYDIDSMEDLLKVRKFYAKGK